MANEGAKGISDRNTLKQFMKAIILYDLFVLATKANAMLYRAAHRADLTLYWEVTPWQVDLLHRSLTAEVAFKDAQEAQLLVLAVHDQATLPAWLLDWLEHWAQQRLVKDAALAVFDGSGNGDALSVFAAPALSQLAQRHGLSFIFSDVCPVTGQLACKLSSAAAEELVPCAMGWRAD